jgi:tyrosinase
MAKPVSSETLPVADLDRAFYRADIELHGLDHSGATYEGRIYLNNPGADEATGRDPESGYAGCFHIFGHGGCLGDPGHCDVVPRRAHDPRPAHPLTPARKVITATEAVRHAIEAGEDITVTIVPVILSTTVHIGRPDDMVKFDHVRIVTYR